MTGAPFGVHRMTIPRFPATQDPADIARSPGEAGCVVVTGLFDAGYGTPVREELAPCMAKAKVARDEPGAFFQGSGAGRVH